ncbi:antibiotic biosynthesis monooxygenase [Rhodococcus fascians]|nr:antibiotic biosynthesis monooxygenase [Rhodococcus fascians]MBY4237833.1 antibiotic biosynthesis monooxygenase [Rhodococcus fascians]MBY4253416.1 antibiotic biosynthesis monooxygenase [Rhodococcus fascians]MBY4269053.1 antibiotic biosynthesis monooxygenase [Rhodococcus fascians]MBY4275106.1 antibiotic biosynthesis monooxygenase [Rhodococcus fascians]
MSEIRATVTMSTEPSAIERVKETVSAFVETARTSEPGVLNLSYYVNDANDTIVVQEQYVDADAMIAHVTGMDPSRIEVLVSLVNVESMIVTGEVTDELQNLLQAFGNATVYVPLLG